MKFKHQGHCLKVFRETRGLAQREIASKMGVHKQQISNAERGIAGLTPKIGKALIRLGMDKSLLMSCLLQDFVDLWEKQLNGRRKR